MSNRIFRLITACSLLALLGGCNNLAPASYQTNAKIKRTTFTELNRRPVKQLLAFSVWAYSQTPASLCSRYDQTRKQIEDHPSSPVQRLELALLLSLPDTPFQDDNLALQHFKIVRQQTTDTELKDFIDLQQLRLVSRQRQQQHWEQQFQQEQNRRISLERQLEELKAIESDLGNRNDSNKRGNP